LGETIGIVDVGGGGAVFVGGGVNVAPTVGSASVAEGVIRNNVGVSVTTGVATGKLQASIARMRTSAGNKTRGLIISPYLNVSYTGFMIPLTNDLKRTGADEHIIRSCCSYLFYRVIG
jgi:hypothetical protein